MGPLYQLGGSYCFGANLRLLGPTNMLRSGYGTLFRDYVTFVDRLVEVIFGTPEHFFGEKHILLAVVFKFKLFFWVVKLVLYLVLPTKTL